MVLQNQMLHYAPTHMGLGGWSCNFNCVILQCLWWNIGAIWNIKFKLSPRLTELHNSHLIVKLFLKHYFYHISYFHLLYFIHTFIMLFNLHMKYERKFILWHHIIAFYTNKIYIIFLFYTWSFEIFCLLNCEHFIKDFDWVIWLVLYLREEK